MTSDDSSLSLMRIELRHGENCSMQAVGAAQVSRPLSVSALNPGEKSRMIRTV